MTRGLEDIEGRDNPEVGQEEWESEFWKIVDTYGGGAHIDLPLKLKQFIRTHKEIWMQQEKDKVRGKVKELLEKAKDAFPEEKPDYREAYESVLIALNHL